MQSHQAHHASSNGNRQGPNGPSPNGNGHRKKAERPFTMFDDVLLDEVMPTLSPAAWKVLSYILRRTIGYEDQPWATISYSQFRAGRRRDGGAGKGLGSDATIKKALAELEGRGLIEVQRLDRHDGDKCIPTAVYRAVLPLSATETVVDMPAAATETVADSYRNCSTSATETVAVNYRNCSTSATVSVESKRDVKKRTKETIKETSTETLSSRAGARACARENEPHSPAGGTDPSREAEAPRETQMGFIDNLVHGPQIAPSAITTPEGESVPTVPAAGRRGGTKDMIARDSNTPVGDEPDDLWAALEHLRRIFGRKTSGPTAKEYWRKACAPLVAKVGSRAEWSRFCTYLEGDSWPMGLDKEGKPRNVWIKADWLEDEFYRWYDLPEPRPQNKQLGATTNKHQQQELARLRYKDPHGRLVNSVRDAELTHRCVGCAGNLGTVHLEDCRVRPLGDVVTPDHTNGKYVVEQLAALRAQRSGQKGT